MMLQIMKRFFVQWTWITTCHLITFEKFSIHRLLLRSYDVIDEIECCQVQDPQGVEWGTNGFIMMEQHKCLIKSIVDLKVYKCFQKRSTTLKCIFIHMSRT
ncbi:unnamed protein product [Brassica oleracea var. botrytis]